MVLFGESIIAHVAQLRIGEEIILGYLDGSKVQWPMSLKDTEEECRHNGETYMKTDVEPGIQQPQAEERLGSLRAGNDKEDPFSPTP